MSGNVDSLFSHDKHTNRASVFPRSEDLYRGLSHEFLEQCLVHAAELGMFFQDRSIGTVSEENSRPFRTRFPAGVIIHLVEFFDGEVETFWQRLSGNAGLICEAPGKPPRQRLHLNSRTRLGQKHITQGCQVIAQRSARQGLDLLGPAPDISSTH